jgi:hypothetical protein
MKRLIWVLVFLALIQAAGVRAATMDFALDHLKVLDQC